MSNELRLDLSEYSIDGARKKTASAKKVSSNGALSGFTPFEEMLSQSIAGVNDLQLESDSLVNRLATGDVDDISEVVLASSRAEVAMKMLMEVRTKLVEAYQQISRIQG